MVAAIAEIELPAGRWGDLINVLLANIQTGDTSLKQSTLQALGYVCESTVSCIMAMYLIRELTICHKTL